MAPCFPPYYQVYEYLGTESLKFLTDHLSGGSLQQMGEFLVGEEGDGGGPDLFLEVQMYLRQMDELSRDPLLVKFYNENSERELPESRVHPLVERLHLQ